MRGGYRGKRRTVAERLKEKYIVDPDTGCWMWQAAINSDGYGHMGVGKRIASAYKVAYELTFGPVPTGLELDHLCKRKSCVNPYHLEAVTHKENCLRQAKSYRKGVCGNGHILADVGFYLTGRGYQCAACCKDYQKAYHLRKKLAKALR